LPNGDKNIYYAINEEPYIIEDGKKKPKNRYSMDVRVSEPLNWIEVEGIEIDKEMFDYLNKICEDSLVCHLNNYTGALTQEQKEYIKKNKWSTDLEWIEKPKKEYESSNPWR
jgi:methyl coenzyme M reductase subunit D